MRYRRFLFGMGMVFALLAPGAGQAQLTGSDTLPGTSCAGLAEGTVRLSADADLDRLNVVLVCDGANWQIVENTVTKIRPSGIPCNAPGDKGTLRYSTTDDIIEFCDGTSWRMIVQTQPVTQPVAPSGLGYFVLTDAVWSGDLGGIPGANEKCLTELTTKTDWRGHGDALANGQLIPSKVQAWLATDGMNLLPLARYQYARVGDPAAGGASLYTNASAGGPYTNAAATITDTTLWNAADRFGIVATYWTGRRGSNGCNGPLFAPHCAFGTCNSMQSCGSYAGDDNECKYFTNGTAGMTATYGISNGANSSRHQAGNSACNTTHRLICMVHPNL